MEAQEKGNQGKQIVKWKGMKQESKEERSYIGEGLGEAERQIEKRDNNKIKHNCQRKTIKKKKVMEIYSSTVTQKKKISK